MNDKELEAIIQKYGELKGQQYMEEAERLNNDPNFVFPEELDRKCLDIIAKAFEEKIGID